MTGTTDLVHRYFDLAAGADTDAYLDQFAADAVVEDEGHEHHGLAAVRAWRHGAPPVTYTVREIVDHDGGHAAHTEIAGDFPGSPVALTFRFTFTGDGHVRTLSIRP
ncbi:nuclear transport factor 2 family protein [Pseudonocardia sp. KRD291]|uniref:nuclear transport factor 2 family protein n=1 Tax=Pseudonocardia sp. KRD291 TaxID=2792007 RepID=UPI001C49E427|nr:nuclear transport factor 2 family protein [Pseudonocardia sp. KRD291]MBW0105906.1 nuclear transport factor 2 family protein [Pseudonocardia sp. KRD291]